MRGMCMRAGLVVALAFGLAGSVFAAQVLKKEAVHWTKKDERVMETFWDKAPRNVLSIPKTDKAPKIDGAADDICWQTASVIDTFTITRGFAPKPPMRWGIDAPLMKNVVRVCYDDQFLYVHFTCYEVLMTNLAISREKRDDAVWKDDCLEFFVDTNLDRKTEYHVIVNAHPAIYDSLDGVPKEEEGSGKAFNFKAAEAAVKKYDDRWEMEARFDFASIGGAPKPGARWGMDFCRQRRGSGLIGQWTYATWAGAPFGFSGNPDKRGDIVFGDIAVHADALPRPFLGKGELGYTVLASAKARTLTAHVEVVDQFGDLKKSAPVTSRIPAGKKTVVRVPFQVTTEGIQYATLVVKEGDTVVLTARKGFTVTPVKRQLDAILPSLKELEAKSQNPEFKESMGAYRGEVEKLSQEVDAFVAKTTAAPMDETLRQDWEKLYRRVREVQSRTTYLVWTKPAFLPTSPADFPSKLEDATNLSVRACINEYEVKAVMVTNLSNEHLDLILTGTDKVPGLKAIRSPVMTAMSTVVDENPQAFKFDTVRGFNLPADTGEPLMRLGDLDEIVVPPLASRQLLLVFHTKGMKARRTGGAFQIYPLNKSYAPKTVKVTLQVDDFEIAKSPRIHTHWYDYGGDDKMLQHMKEHKVTMFFLSDFGRMGIDKKTGAFTHKAEDRQWPLKLKYGAKGWAYGIVNGFVKFAKKHAKELPYMSDKYKAAFKKVVTDMVAWGKECGLKEDEIYVMSWDEVAGKEIDVTRDHLKLLREVAPKLKVAWTCQVSGKDRDKLVGLVNVWVTGGGYLWDSKRQISKGWKDVKPGGFYDQRRDAGDEVGAYNCGTPVRGMRPLGYYRMAGWRAFDCQMDHYAIFALGYLLYKMNGEIIPIRGWEAYREGFEDWQYADLAKQEMARLRTKGKTKEADEAKAEMVAIFKDVFKSGAQPKDTPELAATIESARTRLADLILKLKKTK